MNHLNEEFKLVLKSLNKTKSHYKNRK